jgi:DNA-binding FadR family transcriptional regulator
MKLPTAAVAPKVEEFGKNIREKAKLQIQAIERHFEHAITERVMAEGDRLPSERQLARDFAASRASVRSALASLAQAKLIERRLGSGTYVSASFEASTPPFTFETPSVSPLDVMEARRVIEPGFAELVVARATEDDLAKMRDRLRDVESAQDPISYKIASYNFHHEVARATRNPLLIAMHAMLIAARAKARWATLIPLNDTDELRRKQAADIRAIYESLRDRNNKRASQISYQSLTALIQTILTLPIDA